MIIILLARCDCFRMAMMYKSKLEGLKKNMSEKQETDVKNGEEEQEGEEGDENVGERPRENQEEELEAESEREVNNEDVERDA